MNPEELDLSVVLVNYNGADCLPAALEALARNTSTESVEGIVVDSGSTDGSWQDVPKLWDRARAIRFDENIGFCVGCNRGAEAARGRLLAFVNFDSVVEEDWDRPLRELLEDPSIAVATGLTLSEDGQTLESVGLGLAPNTAAYGRQWGMPRSAAPDEPIEVAAASGSLMMVRRADFLALGGFYEPIFMYGEEADYCLRARGKVVLHPASAARHEFGHASGPHQSPLADLLVVSQPPAERRAPSLDPGTRRIGARLGRLRRDDACPGAKPPGAERDLQGLAGRTAPDGPRAPEPLPAGAPGGDPPARVVQARPSPSSGASVGRDGPRLAPDVSETPVPRSILLVAQLTPPSGLIAARRASAFAKYLGRLGHRVTVLTSRTSGEGDIEGAAEVVRTGDALTTRLNWRRSHFKSLSGGDQSGYGAPSRLESLVVPDLAVGTWLPFALPRAISLARKQDFDVVLTTLAAAVGPSRRARSRAARLAVDRRAARRLDVRAASCALALEGAAQAGRRAREEGRGQGERNDRRHRADRRGPERAPRRARRADHERLRPGGRARRERCRLVARSGTPFDRPHGPDRGGEEQCWSRW